MRKHSLISIAALLTCQAAGAQTYKGVAFGGASVGRDVSGYAGVTHALPGGSLGKGLAIRGTGWAGTFSYFDDGTEFEGEYVGSEVALVSQHSGSWGWANVGVGPRVAYTDVSPDDPDNDLLGTKWDLGLSTDGGVNLNSDWLMGWQLSAGVFRETYQARASLGKLIDRERQMRLGVDVGVQGDPNYTNISGGLYLSALIGQGMNGYVSAGIGGQDGRDVAPYAAFGISKMF